MAECSQLQIYEIEKASDHGRTCTVRCISGTARLGQVFVLAPEDYDAPAGLHLTLTRIERYGNAVEFFDPPHTAKVELSGDSGAPLSRGSIIQSSL